MTSEEITNNHKIYQTKEYMEHEIFSILNDLMMFYKSLSFNVMGFLHPGVALQTLFNIDTYVYSSIGGTLDSIRLVLGKGRISDAFSLTRKYHDMVVIDIYKSMYVKKHQDKDIGKWIVKKINDWVTNNGRLPWYEIMINYIQKDNDLEALRSYFDFGETGMYSRIRKLCNNYNHANSFYYIMMNDNEILNKYRIKELTRISNCVRDIFIFHFAYCISLNPHYIMASDYTDALDCGMPPEKGSEYWVASFAQKIFDKYIKTHRPELAAYIIKNNAMQFD